jgi:hypothetical protein
MKMATHEQAEMRVQRGFMIHVIVFCLVVTGLAVFNYQQNPDRPWSAWVAGGWGLGVLCHAAAFFLNRERMIERTENRMERRGL